MQILELTTEECVEMLTRLNFGRLGCSCDNQPYIVPINFAYHEQRLYSVAILGQKIEWMRANPLVCVEADEIIDHQHWTSVVVEGRYEECTDTPEGRTRSDLAFTLLQQRASWWEPAGVKKAHLGAGEQVTPTYYHIHVDRVTGRRAKPDAVEEAALFESATTSRFMRWVRSLLRRVGPSGV